MDKELEVTECVDMSNYTITQPYPDNHQLSNTYELKKDDKVIFAGSQFQCRVVAGGIMLGNSLEEAIKFACE